MKVRSLDNKSGRVQRGKPEAEEQEVLVGSCIRDESWGQSGWMLDVSSAEK